MEENLETIYLGPDRFSVQVNRDVLKGSGSRYFNVILESSKKEDLNCTDVESKLKLLKFLLSSDVKRDLREEGSINLMGVVELLKYFHDDGFYNGTVTCLEYLESVPWTEREGRFIVDYLGKMDLYETFTKAALARVPKEPFPFSKDEVWNLMKGITKKPTDEKTVVRNEIRNLIFDVVTGEPNITRVGKQNLLGFAFDESYTTLQEFCGCTISFQIDAKRNATMVSQVAQHLWWLVGLMIDEVLADDIVDKWVKESKFIDVYKGMNTYIRYEFLMVPIKICIGIGSKKILAPVDARSSLLETWMPFIYSDYKNLIKLPYFVKEEVEEGIGKTILTLPYKEQKSFFKDWFVKFHDGGDCPNLRLSYQVWWILSHSQSVEKVLEQPD